MNPTRIPVWVVVLIPVLVACAGSADLSTRSAARVPARPVVERDAGALSIVADAGTSTEEPEIPLSVEATLLPDEEALDVRLELAVGWVGPPHGTAPDAHRGVAAVAMAFADDLQFATGRGFAQFVSVLDGAGASSPWPARLGVVNGRVSVRYRVALRHRHESPARGLDEVPHPTRAGWSLTGRAFVPRQIRLDDGRALDVAARMTLHVPTGWATVGSPDRDGDRFVASSFRRLADAVYAVGRVHSADVHVGEVTITVVTGDFDVAELGRVTDLVRRTLSDGQELLGALPPSRLLVVFDRNPVGIDGGVYGRAISVLTELPPTGRGREDAAIVTVHEIMHLWNRSEAFWINEGMTRFLEVYMTLRLDRADEAAVMDALLPVVRAYESQAAGRTIAASEGSWGYAAGAVAMLCAETHLRSLGTTTLLDVHRRARTEGIAPGDGNTVSAQSFLAALDAASAETGAYVREIVAHVGPIDVTACFRRGGYGLTRTRHRGQDAVRYRARRIGRRSTAWPFRW